MTEPAIHIDGLGKRYRLGRLRGGQGAAGGYHTLRDALSTATAELVRAVGSRLRGTGARPVPEDFIWALRDVSLDVQPGEVIGIIGGNGAGKSTLLKILSRVTRPTAGRVELCGRVGSLLEVGTGFHPELTGRENIYLSGAILGMRREEIRRKFGPIVEFAEIERFMDTPVKRYSSGMYLRLAFAVAAHLEPEILLVDEVLAVGDASFQRKCLGKMGDVAARGRTVLFVSHNMDAIQRLCPRSVLLEHGRVAAVGDSAHVVSRHLSRNGGQPTPDAWIDVSSSARAGTGEARFVAARYSSRNDVISRHAYPGGPLEIVLCIASDAARPVESLAVFLKTQGGTKVVNADSIAQGTVLQLSQGQNLLRVRIQELHLNPGLYVVGLWMARSGGTVLDHVDSAFDLRVVQAETRGAGVTPVSDGIVPCRFELAQLTSDDRSQYPPLPVR